MSESHRIKDIAKISLWMLCIVALSIVLGVLIVLLLEAAVL